MGIRRSTWITLGGFLLAVAGAVWWTSSDLGGGPQETETPTQSALWELSANDVIRLQVEDLETGRIVRARRDPDAIWILEEPAAPLADIGRLERALTSMLVLRPRDRLESGDLEAYGLAPAQVQVQLEMADGSTRVLQLGRPAPTGAVTYARLPQTDRVYFLPRAVVQPVIDLLDPPPIATEAATPELPALGGTDAP